MVAILLAIVAIALGGWLVDKASKDARRWQQWKSEAVRVQGRVTNLEISGSGKSRKYRVEYLYGAAEDTLAGSSQVKGYEWNRLRRGDAIQVFYRKSEPETNWLTGHEPTGLPGWVGPLVGGLVFLLAAGLVWGVQIHRHYIELGSTVNARVTKVAFMRTSRNGVGGYGVEYVFLTAGGETINGKTSVADNPPAEGSELTVLYMPDNPRRNAPYPLVLAKVAE